MDHRVRSQSGSQRAEPEWITECGARLDHRVPGQSGAQSAGPDWITEGGAGQGSNPGPHCVKIVPRPLRLHTRRQTQTDRQTDRHTHTHIHTRTHTLHHHHRHKLRHHLKRVYISASLRHCTEAVGERAPATCFRAC